MVFCFWDTAIIWSPSYHVAHHSCRSACIIITNILIKKKWGRQLLPRLQRVWNQGGMDRPEGVKSGELSSIFHGTVWVCQAPAHLLICSTNCGIIHHNDKFDVHIITAVSVVILQQSDACFTKPAGLCNITPVRDCRWSRYLLPSDDCKDSPLFHRAFFKLRHMQVYIRIPVVENQFIFQITKVKERLSVHVTNCLWGQRGVRITH